LLFALSSPQKLGGVRILLSLLLKARSFNTNTFLIFLYFKAVYTVMDMDGAVYTVAGVIHITVGEKDLLRTLKRNRQFKP